MRYLWLRPSRLSSVDYFKSLRLVRASAAPTPKPAFRSQFLSTKLQHRYMYPGQLFHWTIYYLLKEYILCVWAFSQNRTQVNMDLGEAGTCLCILLR